jgi:fructose-1-phosphate kinase PfkB-like protein
MVHFIKAIEKSLSVIKAKNYISEGSLITRSHFKWIMKRYPQFKNADQVIVTGSSAGGIATYLWTNYARTLVSNTSNVISIPDSRIFLITKTF